jgi:peptidoglycan/LPS O-acetylase OafA/YrhL
MSIAAPSGKIPVVEYLRGLAALSVAWFHLTNSHPWGVTRAAGHLGWLGVEVFFVISGFVLPLSIWSRFGTKYRLADFTGFFARRIVRIEPPYLASVLLAAGLWILSAGLPGFRGEQPELSVGQLLSHIAYLPSVLGYPSLQPIYWTLGYEFCFYIVIGLLFSVLIRFPLVTLVAAPAAAVWGAWLAFAFFEPRILLFPIGGAVFLHAKGVLTRGGLFATIAGFAALISLADWKIAVVGAVTALLIHHGLSFSFRSLLHRPLMFAGAISYSLYVTHVPVGGRLVNLGTRFLDAEPARFILSLAGLLVCFGFAWGFYRLLERPFLILSKRIGRARSGSEGSPAPERRPAHAETGY